MLMINIYENHIMSPAKCGSRFLDSILDKTERLLPQELLTKLPKVEYVVIRNPYEHLISALHTDLLHVWNKEWEDATEEDVIRWYSTEEGGSHYWMNLYKTIYEYWEATNKSSKIILLHQLSDLADKLNIPHTYNESDYEWLEFDIWKSKSDVIKYVIDTYPKQYELMMRGALLEQQYYHKFIDELIKK